MKKFKLILLILTFMNLVAIGLTDNASLRWLLLTFIGIDILYILNENKKTKLKTGDFILVKFLCLKHDEKFSFSKTAMKQLDTNDPIVLDNMHEKIYRLRISSSKSEKEIIETLAKELYKTYDSTVVAYEILDATQIDIKTKTTTV